MTEYGRRIFLCGHKTDSCRLFRNLGNWQFEDVTKSRRPVTKERPASWNKERTFVDLNKYGFLDIYAGRIVGPTSYLL